MPRLVQALQVTEIGVVEREQRRGSNAHSPEDNGQRARPNAPLTTSISQSEFDVLAVTWSENYGGYWVVTGLEEVSAFLRRPDLFSAIKDLSNPNSPFRGIQVPDNNPEITAGFLEKDPPLQLSYRHVLNSYILSARSSFAMQGRSQLQNEHAEQRQFRFCRRLAWGNPSQLRAHPILDSFGSRWSLPFVEPKPEYGRAVQDWSELLRHRVVVNSHATQVPLSAFIDDESLLGEEPPSGLAGFDP